MARRGQRLEEQLAGAAGEASDAPGARRRSKRHGRLLKVIVLGGVVAIATKPQVRNRVLDALFGPEEQFDYESLTEPVTPRIDPEDGGPGWPSPAAGTVAEDGEDDGPSWTFANETDWGAAIAPLAGEQAETSVHDSGDDDDGRAAEEDPLVPPDGEDAPPTAFGVYSSYGAEPPADEDPAPREYGSGDPAPGADELPGYQAPSSASDESPAPEAYEPPAYESPAPETYEPPAYESPAPEAYEPPAYESPAYESPAPEAYEPPAYEPPALESYDSPSIETFAAPASESSSSATFAPPAYASDKPLAYEPPATDTFAAPADDLDGPQTYEPPAPQADAPEPAPADETPEEETGSFRAPAPEPGGEAQAHLLGEVEYGAQRNSDWGVPASESPVSAEAPGPLPPIETTALESPSSAAFAAADQEIFIQDDSALDPDTLHEGDEAGVPADVELAAEDSLPTPGQPAGEITAENTAPAAPEPKIGEAGPPPRGGWWLSRRRRGQSAAPEPPRWD